MEKLNISLCCGAGIFSGFLAQQMRGAAKGQGIMAKVEAESQNNITDNLPKTDIPLIGPHLSYTFGELEAMCDPYAVPVLIIPKDMHVELGGRGSLVSCTGTLKKKR